MVNKKVKNIIRIILDLLRSRQYIPHHFEILYRDILNIPFYPHDNHKHLKATIDWLTIAQDINNDNGVSAGYSLQLGWLPSYPETTGYIIPTLINYYYLIKNNEYLTRAIKMADWLISIQLSNGAFKGLYGNISSTPLIFNTGQILQGFISIFKETLDKKYLNSAVKAGNWLIINQDSDGAWRKYTFKGIPHVYHTRVSWPLIELHQITGDENYIRGAKQNINWALKNQNKNGWFNNNSFLPDTYPYLHTIAYAIEGLLESSLLCNINNWFEASVTSSESLLNQFNNSGQLYGIYNNNWNSTVSYRCITGEAQISLCWLRLYSVTGEKKYFHAANNLINSIKTLQYLDSRNNNIKGGIKGSHPIWQEYSPFKYPNWSAKFFADALIASEKLNSY